MSSTGQQSEANDLPSIGIASLKVTLNSHQKARMVGERIRDLGSDRTEDVGVAV